MRWRVSRRRGISRRDSSAAWGVGGIGKQAVDQRRLRVTGLFEKFRDLEFVKTAMSGSLPLVTHP
jgi:hypothetical protein